MPKPISRTKTAARTAIAIITSRGSAVMLGIAALHRLGQVAFLAEIAHAVPEAGAQAREAVAAGDTALGVFASDLVDEQVLQGHDLAFHAHHFGDMGNFSAAVAETRGLH